MKRDAGIRVVGHRYQRSFAERFHRLNVRVDALTSRQIELHNDHVALFRDAEAVAGPFGLEGRALPPLALDVLSWIEVDGEHWRWRGRTNNKGLPVLRHRSALLGTANTEWSAHRLIHRLLVTDHETPPNLRQRCSAEYLCVRPAHRCRACV